MMRFSYNKVFIGAWCAVVLLNATTGRRNKKIFINKIRLTHFVEVNIIRKKIDKKISSFQ